MFTCPTRWMKNLLLQLPRRPLRSKTQVQWLPLHVNDLGKRMVMEGRRLRMGAGAGVVEVTRGDEETEVDAIRREIWGVWNGGV